MPRLCHVHLLPALVQAEEFAGTTAVVIDVLRATTTIAYALAAGVRDVIPCQEVAEARQIARDLGTDTLLGGERGERIDGFDLGNSPAEYTPERLAGKTLVFTSTNGTRAMRHARLARVLLGAFVNLSALCQELVAAERIAILCAGTDGEITREDTLLAGAIADELFRLASCAEEIELNDQAEIAADAWRALVRDIASGKPLAAHLRTSQGARNLIDLGMERDIDIAAEIDKFEIVPELDVAASRIRVA